MAILGISTNTRLLGLAIIKQGRLDEYKMYLNKSSWSPSKAKMIVASLEPCVRQYSITKVILSMPHVYHRTTAFTVLISRIKKLFEERHIPIYEETPPSLTTLCPPGQKKTKKAVMRELTLRYPQLTYCYKKEMRNKNKYYIKLFEAVAAATLHSE